MAPALKIIADENMPAVEALFASHAEIRRLPGRTMRAADLSDADILLVRSVTRVDARLLSQATRLQFVGTATIGTDHIDRQLLAQQGIGFASAPGCNADGVVDYALCAIWNWAADAGRALSELTFAVVGCGNVGSRLVARLQAYGLRVLVSDPPRAKREPAFADTSLARILEQADVICCHTPLVTTGEHPTQHLFDRDRIRALKPGALLLNAGRGPVVDNQALLEALQSGQALNVVLDVWEAEPLVNRELAQRCYLATPHIAGYSLDGKLRGTWMLYQAIRQRFGFTDNVDLQSILPPARVSQVRLSGELEEQRLMQLVYDIWRDDRAFRQSLDRDAGVQQKNFDLLRRHYPERREYGSLAISGADPQQRRQLRALGFAVPSAEAN